MSELSEESKAILREALDRQAGDWFSHASDLTIATGAIKHEMETGGTAITPRLSPEQLAQRKQILGIAHAVIDAARKRALENFYGSLKQRDAQAPEPNDSPP